MRRAGSAAELLVDPIGAYLPGRSFVAWVQCPERIGAFHFGPLDSADHAALAALFPLPTSPALAPRYDLLHDLGAVEEFDRKEFEFFEGFLAQWVEEVARRTRRLAVVRPIGLAGAAFTGLYHEWVAPRFEAKLCSDRGEALAWFELDPDAPPRGELDALYETYLQPNLLRRVRELLSADLGAATLEAVAETLAMTPRTLQRQLASLDTSFRVELERARIRIAEIRLLDRDDKIELIALELGFSSAAAFSAMFQKVAGESPGAFRARRRGGR
jgi:AraC-like DNA-binding protein